jgi:hypothetical protein
MYSNELLKKAKDIPGFMGVFALNKIPQHIAAPACFIVNTDTHNLEGEHWLAVSFESHGRIYVFDPFGMFYPKLLTDRLHCLPKKRIIYNTVMYQKPWEKTCGQYCLDFLKTRTINRMQNV